MRSACVAPLATTSAAAFTGAIRRTGTALARAITAPGGNAIRVALGGRSQHVAQGQAGRLALQLINLAVAIGVDGGPDFLAHRFSAGLHLGLGGLALFIVQLAIAIPVKAPDGLTPQTHALTRATAFPHASAFARSCTFTGAGPFTRATARPLIDLSSPIFARTIATAFLGLGQSHRKRHRRHRTPNRMLIHHGLLCWFSTLITHRRANYCGPIIFPFVFHPLAGLDRGAGRATAQVHARAIGLADR